MSDVEGGPRPHGGDVEAGRRMTATSPSGDAAHIATAITREAGSADDMEPEKSPRLVSLTCSDRGTHPTVQLAVARDSRRSANASSGEHGGRITVSEMRPTSGWIRNGAKRGVARAPVTHDSPDGKRNFTLGCTRCTRRPTLSEDELGALLERLYEALPQRQVKDDFARNSYDWSLDVSWRS